MTESAYYEADALWQRDRYDRTDEQERIATCGRLVPPGTTTLLDAGAGQGAFLRWLEQHRSEIRLSGVERSRSAIDAAVCDTPIELGSIDALAADDRSADVVTALEVLEHLPHGVYEPGLRELERVARNAIIVSVPYAERRVLVKCPQCGCRFHPSYHMRSFEPSAFASLFPQFILDESRVLYFDDYLGGPQLRWAYRMVRGGAGEMPPAALCPQCGYRGERASASRLFVRHKVKGRLPTRRRPRWLVGRFKRA